MRYAIHRYTALGRQWAEIYRNGEPTGIKSDVTPSCLDRGWAWNEWALKRTLETMEVADPLWTEDQVSDNRSWLPVPLTSDPFVRETEGGD